MNPFVHKETESSCSSMVFTLQNAIAKTLPIPVNVHYGRKQKSRKKKSKSSFSISKNSFSTSENSFSLTL